MFTPDGIYTPNQNLSGVYSSSQHQSVLTIIKPARRFTDQGHRPLVYNISDSFLGTAAEKFNHAMVTPGAMSSHLVNTIVNDPTAHACAMPTQSVDAMVNMQGLSENWRFVFVIHKVKMDQGGISPFSQNVKHRIVYYGFFLDEPFAPFNHKAFNPNAGMVFTHRTVVEDLNSDSYAGTASNIFTRSDDSIVQPNAIYNTTNMDKLYFVDPESSQAAIEFDGSGASTIMPGEMQNISQMPPTAKDTSFNMPDQNLKKIVSGVMMALQDVRKQNNLPGMHRGPMTQYGGASPFSHNSMSELLGQYFQSRPMAHETLGPKINELKMLTDLLAEYPDTHVIPVFPEQAGMFGCQDQSEQSVRMIFSNLLSNTLPSIIAHANLSSLAFEYETHRTGLFGRAEPSIRYDHIESIMPMSNEMMALRAEAVLDELKSPNGIFSIMETARGDFHVHVQINAAGASYIALNFKCDNQVIIEPYEAVTVFDGLYSPMYGDMRASHQNAHQLNAMLNVMIDTSGNEMVKEQPRLLTNSTGFSRLEW